MWLIGEPIDLKQTARQTLRYRREIQMEFNLWLAGRVDFCAAFLCLRPREGSFSSFCECVISVLIQMRRRTPELNLSQPSALYAISSGLENLVVSDRLPYLSIASD